MKTKIETTVYREMNHAKVGRGGDYYIRFAR